MKPDRYSAAAKLSCEPYLLSPSAYSNDEIYLDTLPATVEAMRSGWIRAFQSAATVVRAPFNFAGSEDHLTYECLVRVISRRRGSNAVLLQGRIEIQAARLHRTSRGGHPHIRSHHFQR